LDQIELEVEGNSSGSFWTRQNCGCDLWIVPIFLDLGDVKTPVFLGDFAILVAIPTTGVLGIILAKSAAGNDEVFSRVSYSPLL